MVAATASIHDNTCVPSKRAGRLNQGYMGNYQSEKASKGNATHLTRGRQQYQVRTAYLAMCHPSR